MRCCDLVYQDRVVVVRAGQAPPLNMLLSSFLSLLFLLLLSCCRWFVATRATHRRRTRLTAGAKLGEKAIAVGGAVVYIPGLEF